MSDSEMSDISDFDVGCNAVSLNKAAEGIQELSNQLEKTVSEQYPFLVHRTDPLTKDDWVLDSGCGFGLTTMASAFVTKVPDESMGFTFGEGTILHNTHLGCIKLFFMSPNGIQPFQFDNVALVPGAKSNILSEYWLKRMGYQIVESTKGEYKFVLWKHKLVFVAHAVNGAYYIRHYTLRERQQFCHAVKHTAYKPLTIADYSRVETILKEWHVRLGHVSKEKLITMLSQQLVRGLPQVSAKDLGKVPFFCQTCAEMKKNRMSYRNMRGSRDDQPISTIHMDTNGPMKSLGIYGLWERNDTS